MKEDATKAEYLSGKSFTVTLNGQTKTFTLGEIDPSKGNLHEQVKQNLQEGLDKAFGKGKITVDMDTTGPGERSFLQRQQWRHFPHHLLSARCSAWVRMV